MASSAMIAPMRSHLSTHTFYHLHIDLICSNFHFLSWYDALEFRAVNHKVRLVDQALAQLAAFLLRPLREKGWGSYPEQGPHEVERCWIQKHGQMKQKRVSRPSKGKRVPTKKLHTHSHTRAVTHTNASTCNRPCIPITDSGTPLK